MSGPLTVSHGTGKGLELLERGPVLEKRKERKALLDLKEESGELSEGVGREGRQTENSH